MLKQIITTQYTYLGNEPKRSKIEIVAGGMIVLGFSAMMAYSLWSMII